MRRLTTFLSLSIAMMLILTACGTAAGANTAEPPPTLPPAPPLAPDAAAAINQPTPTPPAAAPAPVVPQSGVLVNADFENGSLDGWTAEDFSEGPDGPATWVAEQGVVFQKGDSVGLPAPDTTYLFTGEAGWTDYTVSAYAYATNSTRFGLIARKTANSYYQTYLDVSNDASNLVLAAVEKGTTRELARVPVAQGTRARWLELRLDVRGSTITATLDGTTKVVAQDSALKSGQAGLQATADDTTRFDNVVIAE